MHELANLAASKAQEKCPMSSSETKKPNDTPDKKVIASLLYLNDFFLDAKLFLYVYS